MHLEIPHTIACNLVTIHALSRGIKNFLGLVLNMSRKEGILHSKFNTFDQISVVEHKRVFGGISW